MAGTAAALRQAGWRVTAAALTAAILAAGWMLISLAAGRAGLGTALTAHSLGQAALSQSLTRTGVTRQGNKIQVFLAIPEFYERTGQAEAAAEAEPEKYLVFIVTEENHSDLSSSPLPVLTADGIRVASPVKERLLSSSDHHRTRLLRFLRTAPDGTAYLPENTRRLELIWPNLTMTHGPEHQPVNPLSWEWPPALPADEAAAPLNPLPFLAMTAGLFSALSPCLLQLTIYYLSALAGAVGTPNGTRQIRKVAVLFVAGVTAAYSLGGLMAGYLGRALQAGAVLGGYGRWFGVAAGVFIFLMGIRTVWQSNDESAASCRVVPAGPLSGAPRTGGLTERWRTWAANSPASPFYMGFLMAFGCLQCFGGALFASLLAYVGSLGSPGLGAFMLFLFSLGIAVPFLAAALAWERLGPRLADLGRIARFVSVASGVLMMSFGILMAIDKFHWISGVILRWLPFLQA